MPKIKNIIIFTVAAVALILIYIFFIKPTPQQGALVSTSSGTVAPSASTSSQDSSITRDFLSLLLNVKNIKLDSIIFSDSAFSTLHDSTIVLTPDGTEGRPNPFAPIGIDSLAAPANYIPGQNTAPATTGTGTGTKPGIKTGTTTSPPATQVPPTP